MKWPSQLLLTLLILLVCQGCFSPSGKSEYYLVTKLGNDTLAIERITIDTLGEIKADVLLRSPRISLKSYHLTYDENNIIKELLSFDNTELGSFKGFMRGSIMGTNYKTTGDSLRINTMGRNGPVTYHILNDRQLLPFIDMVHWPFDLAFQRHVESDTDSIHQYMLSGRRISDFIIHKTGDRSYTLRHPSRGVMEVNTTNAGGLQRLDAKATTRKLIVTRTNRLDFDALVSRFIEKDKAGSPFGTLSGAIVGDFEFGGSEFQVSYGSPAKRGREIFGGIVPYGARWRTGANRATHFKTSKAIKIEGKTIPAGEYTLFTIPEANGGTLIINSQTGQNGRSYDESRDFMRTAMSRSSQSEVTEQFTVKVVETASGGSIQLIWDQTIYSVDFNF
ncbi:hypothetical protein BFP97_01255 [Roseivirga sp. 4D4]|uniref:DUF2911 domain-containing protein n=1 Tax=Roseivirga sp. 4D4 TaxID=1889784 RepID=UPI0008536659|nr:DUF2911 domain-containing protein [Roseivirga sp. 4D4]OEK00221.1 hypothetical protein BFP97_01255 [Roseivirga sp. 4D4]